jgi:hypothetical protein
LLNVWPNWSGLPLDESGRSGNVLGRIAWDQTRIAKLEQARSVRARRYVFHPDEIAEAEAQGLPYVLVPRGCSSGGMDGAVCRAARRRGEPRRSMTVRWWGKEKPTTADN